MKIVWKALLVVAVLAMAACQPGGEAAPSRTSVVLNESSPTPENEGSIAPWNDGEEIVSEAPTEATDEPVQAEEAASLPPDALAMTSGATIEAVTSIGQMMHVGGFGLDIRFPLNTNEPLLRQYIDADGSSYTELRMQRYLVAASGMDATNFVDTDLAAWSNDNRTILDARNLDVLVEMGVDAESLGVLAPGVWSMSHDVGVQPSDLFQLVFGFGTPDADGILDRLPTLMTGDDFFVTDDYAVVTMPFTQALRILGTDTERSARLAAESMAPAIEVDASFLETVFVRTYEEAQADVTLTFATDSEPMTLEIEADLRTFWPRLLDEADEVLAGALEAELDLARRQVSSSRLFMQYHMTISEVTHTAPPAPGAMADRTNDVLTIIQ